ncbi:cytochrome P450 1A2-like isoform X2 [Ostrea edulis]|uniref:cytochrome P450 1A2-like isoform X2 n=1 Tax=Ostrea edulis TaxID=37623 RepID=UPI0024AF8F20|nr:cytochrome P450 1A2-like isoform X2 [Ostrea edulis]
MVYIVILIIVLLFFLLYALLDDLYLFKFKKLPPGPFSLPIIGGVHLLGREPYKSIQNLALKYGDIFSLRMGMRERVVFIEDPELMKQLLKSEYLADRPHSPFFDIISKDGHGIGSRPYDFTWRLHTRLIQSNMSKVIQTQLDDILQNAVEQLFRKLEGMRGEPFAPDQAIHTCFLKTLGSFIFGHDYTAADDYRLQQLLWLNTETMKGLNPVNCINMIPGLKHVSLPFFPNYRDVNKAKEKMLHDEFERHNANFDGHARDMMDVILQELKNSPKLRHPQEEDRLQLNSLLMSLFTLVVAAAFYMETMRYVTSNYFGIPRACSSDIHVRGYIIPKGTTVFPNFWSMNRSEKFWSNPHEFQPDRFLKLDSEQLSNTPGFYVFGYGRRPCIGHQLGRACLFSFLCNIVNKFHVFLPDDEKPDMQGRANLVIEPPIFKLKFQKRS